MEKQDRQRDVDDACIRRDELREARAEVERLRALVNQNATAAVILSEEIKQAEADLSEARAQIAELHAELSGRDELKHHNRELAADLRETRAKVERLKGAITLVLAEPHGCPMCDSGKLRQSAKESGKGHWPNCGFAAMAELRSLDAHL